MKIIVFYASYGGGHLSAANSIKSYFNEFYPNIEVELIDCMKYINKHIEKLTTNAYKEMAKNAPWAWGMIYYTSQKGPIAEISNASNKIMAAKLNHLLQESKPDLIICTHPFASQMASFLKKHKKINSEIACIMTDFAPHDQWLVGFKNIDYFFVAHDMMRKYLINYGIDPSKIYATGIPLSNRFSKKYLRNDVLSELDLKPNKRNILFFGGGEFGLGKSTTLKILSKLVNDFDDLQVVAISGRNPKMESKFEKIANLAPIPSNIKVLDYTNKVPELMSISDIIITKPGGLTTSEALASGLPIIVINPIPGQETQNAKYLEDNGAGIRIKNSKDIDEVLNSLLNNPQKLEKMKDNAKKISKKDSTKNICEILLNNMKNNAKSNI